MQRIVPGAVIRINRDDDTEKGPDEKDFALNSGSSGDADDRGEGSSSGSGSSRTRQGDVSTLKTKKTTVDGEEAEVEEGSKLEGKSVGQLEREGDKREAAETRSEHELEDAGRKSEPLREFREGNHLVIERESEENGDVSRSALPIRRVLKKTR